jgi:hypothetical protein
MRKREKLKEKQKMVSTAKLDIAIFNRFVAAEQCPYCQDGITYKVLPLHISLIHGISAYELRQEYGFTRGHKLSSPEYSKRKSEIHKKVARNNKPFMQFDRKLSTLHRYEDGGERPEGREHRLESLNRPERRKITSDTFKKLDHKAISAKIPKEVKQRVAHAGGEARWKNVPLEERKKTLANVRARLSPEDKKRRIEHARQTKLSHKFRKIPPSEYPRLISLRKDGKSQKEIAEIYHVSQTHVGVTLRKYIKEQNGGANA